MMFQRVVKTVAYRNGLFADFSPKPVESAPGNGFHINMSFEPFAGEEPFRAMIAGVLENISAMTAFLNTTEASYQRLGRNKAPRYISWSAENRSQLIRIPAAVGRFRRLELRSPDPCANPYLAFALMIYAGLHGIENGSVLPPAADINLYKAGREALSAFEKLPETFREACGVSASSDFIRRHVPAEILSIYCDR
ncbi:MAG: type I glutamate--ammonia ligase, partial [Oscillospiraceae bacterium]|nr:type I glutamate--ammonia ligase [Oscillospiraceae bacterium]